MTPEGRLHYSRGIPKMVKNHKGRKINSAYRESSKLTDKLIKQNIKSNAAERKANKAFTQYAKDAKEYNMISKKLDKAENGISAKLIGANGRKIRKLEQSLDRQEKTMNLSKNDYDVKHAKAIEQKYKSEKIAHIATIKQEKAGKIAAKYIDQYSHAEYKQLYDKYPKLQYYENNH